MIETTIAEVDGVRFYKNIRILEPDDTIGGVGIHRITWGLIDQAPELMFAIRALGLRKVGEDIRRGADQYAQSPIPYLAIKVMQGVLMVYWTIIPWLYDNARIFKQIPAGQRFSWRYFTPYVWYKKIRRTI